MNRVLAPLVGALLLCAGAAFAQGSGSSGDIGGAPAAGAPSSAAVAGDAAPAPKQMAKAKKKKTPKS